MADGGPRPTVSTSPIATAGFVCTVPLRALRLRERLVTAVFSASKAYLSTVTLLLLPLAWLFSGNALRGFRSRAGLCWAGFLVWMLLATPFSVWRGGSATMLANYVPRAYLVSSTPVRSSRHSAAAASGCTFKSPAARLSCSVALLRRHGRRSRGKAIPHSAQPVLRQLQRSGARVYCSESVPSSFCSTSRRAPGAGPARPASCFPRFTLSAPARAAA